MGFSCGIVGLPNVGKSTIFNALTRSQVPAENYPFCTIDPNVGVVPVPDPRLRRLGELVPTERIVPTAIEFVDIAGLVKGASQGEGLRNQFLNPIAQVEAIAHIVRGFEDSQVVHVSGSVDPQRDIEVIHTELALRDLSAVNSTISRLEKTAKSGDKKAAAALQILKEVVKPLDQGQPVRRVLAGLSPDAAEVVRPLNLLTAKPMLYVANVHERELAGADSPQVEAVRAAPGAEGARVGVIGGAMEAQRAALESDAERAEYMEAVGVKEPGLHQMIRSGYALLNLITFFTLGPKEDLAWTVHRGATAPEAAGQVHSDMERGFIRAEVIGYDDFLSCGSEAVARERGKWRVEGKEYVVQDGDLMYFRFSV